MESFLTKNEKDFHSNSFIKRLNVMHYCNKTNQTEMKSHYQLSFNISSTGLAHNDRYKVSYNPNQ